MDNKETIETVCRVLNAHDNALSGTIDAVGVISKALTCQRTINKSLFWFATTVGAYSFFKAKLAYSRINNLEAEIEELKRAKEE